MMGNDYYNQLDAQWMPRILKTSFLSGLLVAILLAQYIHISFALGFLAGNFWNLINLYLIQSLVTGFITLHPQSKSRLILFLILKFPLLYFSGFLLLQFSHLSVISLLLGFHFPFLVILLKAISILLLSHNSS